MKPNPTFLYGCEPFAEASSLVGCLGGNPLSDHSPDGRKLREVFQHAASNFAKQAVGKNRAICSAARKTGEIYSAHHLQTFLKNSFYVPTTVKNRNDLQGLCFWPVDD